MLFRSDLAGFCVGAAERENLLDKNCVNHGDQVIAVASSGIHSNGYSLVRKIIETRSIDIFKKTDFKKN